MKTYTGGCHCGAVRFEADGVLARVTVCNCSLCARTGYLHWYVKPEHFRLLQGDDALITYLWGTGTARHMFCKHCGISAFRHPRSDPHMFNVNVRCLDDVDIETLRVDAFDGQRWEAAVDEGELDTLRRSADES